MFSFVYEKDGSRLIAIGFTWHFGNCFLKLKVLDLKAGTKDVLSELDQRRVFANASGAVRLSAVELARGLVVHSPATPWFALLIERY